jgi:hypothetical protein
MPGDRNDDAPALGILAVPGDRSAVDLKAVAPIGADWTRKRVRPCREDRHTYPITPQVARAVTTADT